MPWLRFRFEQIIQYYINIKHKDFSEVINFLIIPSIKIKD